MTNKKAHTKSKFKLETIVTEQNIRNTFVREDFFDLQTEYSTDEQDYQWSITAHGPFVKLASAQPVTIKQ